MELLASGHGIGCLLKSKVSHLADLIDTCSGSPLARRYRRVL
jgi:hypothetical protein